MNLVWKLLKQNISKVQLFGFFAANLIGLTIVLLGIQFYFDVNSLLSEKDSIIKRDFLILTKQVNMLKTFSPGSSGFSDREIETIKNSDFVIDVGEFMASQYEVFGGINTKQGSLSTEMFFESVPDEFIDVKTENWQFTPEQEAIPIILSRSYLDLYNFGFAEARSMPKITQGMIGMVSFDIVISGKGQHKRFKGRIVGFSNRINTVLVPEAFMKWANENYGAKEKPSPSRLIVEIDNPANPEIATFLQENKYNIEGEADALSKMSYFLKIIVGIVIVIGLIICVLSFFILSLSIYLLLEKNTEKIQNLRLIGYSRNVIFKPYLLLTIGINLSTLFLTMFAVFFVRAKYLQALQTVWPDFNGGYIVPVVLTGILIFLLLSVLNMFVLKRKIR